MRELRHVEIVINNPIKKEVDECNEWAMEWLADFMFKSVRQFQEMLTVTGTSLRQAWTYLATETYGRGLIVLW